MNMLTPFAGCAVFTLTWKTRRFLKNDYLLSVGVALLAASVVNAVHTLSYKGMGVFESQDANLPTQLWIARRYLESIALLAALYPSLALLLFDRVWKLSYNQFHNRIAMDTGAPAARKRGAQWGKTGGLVRPGSPALSRNCSLSSRG